MARPQSIGVHIGFAVRMKYASIGTLKHTVHAWRISQPEDTPSIYVSHSYSVLDQKKTYDGVLLGAQTIAILSDIIVWYPKCVCRSRLLMKHVCVGWVWIQPSTIRSSLEQYSNKATSFTVSQVSLVLICSGITTREMNRALEINVPQSTPHVSRFFLVFEAA